MNIEFLLSKMPVEYGVAMGMMEERVSEIFQDTAKELIWFLEHEAILTAGTSSKEEELLTNNLPVFKTNRGGKFTLHSLGQRVCYVMLNLKKRSNGVPDPKKFVKDLEEVIIASLAKIGIKGEIKEGRIGVWVLNGEKEEKIAAIGVRFKQGVSMHGFAINVSNDLSLFNNIIPCGIREFGVCSIQSLGSKVNMREFDSILKSELIAKFEMERS